MITCRKDVIDQSILFGVNNKVDSLKVKFKEKDE